MDEMLYLGHVIEEDGVRVHHEKIRAILDWPTTMNVIELWVFLGIYTYYRRFGKGVSQIIAPLTNLTKTGAFEWTDVAQEAFKCLKGAMSSCHVLLYFPRPFVVERDASRKGIGALLTQGGNPIAF